VAVAEERARIAREMHDLVAHAVSVMVLQVGAVRHRLDPRHADDVQALENVERAGRAALTEMRRLLAAMRDDGAGELRAHAGLTNLDAWVDGVRAAGLAVDHRVRGDVVPLPGGVDLSAYRIVQEGLTNALKHADAQRADVTLDYRHDELRIEIRDDGRGPTGASGSGHGLVGIGGAREDLRWRHVRRSGGTGRLRPARPAPARSAGAVTIRVLVADDQAMVRAGLRMLLASQDDLEVVAEATDGREAVSLTRSRRPDVVLTDIRMPGLDGLEATRQIVAQDPAARVLILTTFNVNDDVYAALCSGASGFVLKDDPPEQLISAVRTIAAGDALLSPTITKQVIRQFAKRARRVPPAAVRTLTERETDVLRLITRGLSSAEIGRELFISDTTVKTHVTRVLQKLDVRERAQAIVLAYESGLFQDD
jgi:DNA-binding NarL/FixJ family response regulator